MGNSCGGLLSGEPQRPDESEATEDEAAALAEIDDAFAAARGADPDEQIAGLALPASGASICVDILAATERPAQYRVPAGRTPVLTYFCIQGKGELLRLL
eukprot:SAG31_NODE_7091_length_1791_cov_1.579787_1_plen_100_part_00